MPALTLILALSCNKAPDADPSPLLDVPETGSFDLPGLVLPVVVVHTEGDIPHIYAANREDLMRVMGFVLARDRYFVMDMTRRLSKGTVSELLGDAALQSDMEARGTGMTAVAQSVKDSATDEQWAWFVAFSDGINAYVDLVWQDEMDPPSEYELAAPLLGKNDAFELVTKFEPEDVAAMAATIVYELGYETGDVGDGLDYGLLETAFAGQALEELRRAGAYDDVWGRIEPVYPVASAPGWGTGGAAAYASRPKIPHVPSSIRDRLRPKLDRIQRRLRRDHEAGFGSNAWAITGQHTSDGRALLAGDGHLPLTVPSLFYQIGLDTEHFGGGSTHQIGLVIPGLPFLAVGTNGQVAWGQTQLMGDITDWYVEEIQLDDVGYPSQSYFQGEWHGLVSVPETYTVADVAALESVGRTETWDRYTTFDGRWITDIEGVDASSDSEGAVVNVLGSYVIPGDTDGDGKITAISFDYAGFEAGGIISAVDGFGHASDVWTFREATKKLVAYSQNLVVADSGGSIFYTGYQGVPCRSGLPRNEDGTWKDGAHPSLLLDGTQYGAFEIPRNADLSVDEDHASDPARCVVPFDAYPQSVDPPEGFVQTANNDIGGLTFDNSLENDPWYVGGPWLEGFRADTIASSLAAHVAAHTGTVDTMKELQAHTGSRMGETYVPVLLDAIAAARAGASADPSSSEGRMYARYAANAAAWDEVEQRMIAWQESGMPTPSGVDTFYAPLQPGDEESSVATTIFATWVGRYFRQVFDDEPMPGLWRPGGDTGKTRLLKLMLEGRGTNSTGLSSYNPATGESAFFDVLGTDELESSDEVAGMALETALAFLSGPSTGDGAGGYATADMSAWIWGYRHWVHFDSILLELLSGSGFEALTEPFAITPAQIPLADGMSPVDPRASLPGFPRPGDQFAVDAANPGLDGETFDYGSGPVFRMVIALGPDGVEGHNILPGGQSGQIDSAFFSDQAELWLGNQTWPMRFTVDEVLAGAVGRETFQPAPK